MKTQVHSPGTWPSAGRFPAVKPVDAQVQSVASRRCCSANTSGWRSQKLAPIVAGLGLLLGSCSPKSEPPETPPQAEKKSETEPRVKRSTNGEVTINLDKATQDLMGLKTSALPQARLSPELKAYGRVLDIAPLASLVAELASAYSAAETSQADLKRVTTLITQNNASERALQTAKAAAMHDQAQVESLRLRLLGGWGRTIADRKDLPQFVQSLSSLASALVQLDLPAGQIPGAEPTGARLLPLADESHPIQAQFISPAPSVDPQMQGRGFLFLVESNQIRLVPGGALTAFISLPGEPVSGVALPRNAVIRFNGANWVYRQTGDTTFERVHVVLGPPLAEGWFLPEGLKPQDKVVTVAAQQLLSEELKGQGGEE